MIQANTQCGLEPIKLLVLFNDSSLSGDIGDSDDATLHGISRMKRF